MSRTVVVTGGAKGIGRAVVMRFAALGDEVVALGRDETALQRLGSDGIQTAICDVTDEDAVTRIFAEIETVDVLVNNAGIAESAPLARTSLSSWLAHFDVNVTGAFLCMRAVVPGCARVVMAWSSPSRRRTGASAPPTRVRTRRPSTRPWG